MRKEMLGDTICKLRKEKRLSQSELGRLVGVSGKTVRKWEQYKECPNICLLPLLDRVLGKENVDSEIFLYYYDFLGAA